MNALPAPFGEAVDAIDRGNVAALRDLIARNPSLVRDRVEYGEGYFARPYLLWFVAENPVRNDRLPGNIVEVTRVIVDAVKREGVEVAHQLSYALELVSSGRVARESRAQLQLIDLLIDAGADPDSAMLASLAHKERAAFERLLARGARLSLAAAVCARREIQPLLATSSAAERQLALSAASLYGDAGAIRLLLDAGADVNAYSPAGFHPHGTPLHHAVDSGSLDAVRTLVEAGADLTVRDRFYDGTPLGWAEHLGRSEIAAYLRQQLR